jgi:hypothetical protein
MLSTRQDQGARQHLIHAFIGGREFILLYPALCDETLHLCYLYLCVLCCIRAGPSERAKAYLAAIAGTCASADMAGAGS